ncbi:MAG: dipeptidase [Armatimonadota bacterium]|nr:dipeptidase [Armatimonadota bacterium]
MRLRAVAGVASSCLVLLGCLAGGSWGRALFMREVHRSATVVDLHCDTLLEVAAGKRRLDQRSSVGHVDLPRLREGGAGVQVFAVYIAPEEAAHGPARARRLLEAFRRAMAAAPGQIAHATTVEDIERLRRGDAIAAVVAIENGDALGGALAQLDEFHREGVRLLGLTWNASNALGDGALGRRHGGLTDLGRAVLRRMEALGMVPDLAHLSEPSFWDALRATRGPVIVSHANAAAIWRHPRNLTDAQLRAIASRRGVVGVSFAPGFLGGATLAHVLDHIDHMVGVMGIDHVALGSDYDGIPDVPVGLEDVSKLPNLTAGLLARGYRPEHVRKILGGNALRVFRQVWAK